MDAGQTLPRRFRSVFIVICRSLAFRVGSSGMAGVRYLSFGRDVCERDVSSPSRRSQGLCSRQGEPCAALGASGMIPPTGAMTPQCLLIDADDTLWENNILFERVIDRFVGLVAHARLSAAEVREVLDAVERRHLVSRGYGSDAFGQNLQDAYCELAGTDASQAVLHELCALAAGIREQPLTLIQGVAETLAHLATRHKLVLFTKGDSAEQAGKLERSGLSAFFADTRVVREKDTATYRATVEQLGARPDQTWMVGNSPRSDINPALGAGLKAVWVPHPDTWRLEHEEVRRDAPG